MNPDFDTLCVGGGSIRGLCELGALHYLYTENVLTYNSLKTFIGTSAGAMIVLLLSVGYTPMEIFTQIMKIENWMKFEPLDILNIQKHGGLLDIKYIIQHLELMIKRKMHFIPTLNELHLRTGKRLVVCVVNASRKREEMMDYRTEPDLLCTEAVAMSCSMPVVFKRIEYKDCYYIDGAVTNNFPIDYAVKVGERVLGMCVESENRNENFEDSFFSYMYATMTLSTSTIQRMKIEMALNPFRKDGDCPKDIPHILHIVAKNTPALDFKLSREAKLDMFCQGLKIARKYAIKEFWKLWGWEYELFRETDLISKEIDKKLNEDRF